MKTSHCKISLLLILCLSGINLIAQCPAGDLSFTSQSAMDDLFAQYPNCTDLLGSIIISDADEDPDSIINLTSLQGLTSIQGDFRIEYGNELLINIDLPNLEYVGGNFSLSQFEHQISIGFNALTIVEGNFVLYWLYNIESLQGFNNLETIGNEFYLDYFSELQDLTNFQNLTTIGGKLKIWDTANLTSFAGLENLIFVKSFDICGNQNLQDISALSNISEIEGLTICANYNLAFCSLSSICNYLQTGEQYSINNNKLCCEDEAAVLDNCSSEIDEACIFTSTSSFVNEKPRVYPNPIDNTLYIEQFNFTETVIELLDTKGGLIEQKRIYNNVNEMDLSNLPRGLYILKISDVTNKKHYFTKLVKN